MTAPRANLLIISDLHLGDDLKPGVGYLRHVVRLERELESFLSHYTTVRPADGRPWRLLVNGDMVDFLGVCLLADEEHDLGLGTHPRAACAKMRKVLDRHAGVFRALASFIAAGNALDVIVGNHDAEFHWPVVQQTFKQGVAGFAADEARAEVAARINFHPWFYFEEDVAWVEHGHQYDAYCSFDYVLHPASEASLDDSGLVPNVSASLQRHVSNRAGYVAGQENWSSCLDYLRWAGSLGVSGLGRVARGFYLASAELIAAYRRFRSDEARAARREAHRRRVKELADQVRVSEDTLHAVDALRREPVIANLGRLLAALMLDKLLIGAGAIVAALVLFTALPWQWAAGPVAGLVAMATVVSRRLQAQRDPTDATPAIHEASLELRRRVRAPFFIFGHTHDPQAVPLEGGGWLFNTGTWVPDEGSHGRAQAFTHVMIRHEADGLRASLCQWRDGASFEMRASR